MIEIMDDLKFRWRDLLGKLVSSQIEEINSKKGNLLLDDLKKIHNKLALAAMTQERYILSVTGLQGAGKTSLIKRLYQLDDEYLPENLSRGERIPVLITESDVTRPQGIVSVSIRDVFRGGWGTGVLSVLQFEQKAVSRSSTPRNVRVLSRTSEIKVL